MPIPSSNEKKQTLNGDTEREERELLGIGDVGEKGDGEGVAIADVEGFHGCSTER